MATYVGDENQPKDYGLATSIAAGVGSGIVKTVEGVVSLGAELMDLGAGALINLPSTKGSAVSAAQEVEAFFETLNVFEETARSKSASAFK